MSNKEEWLQVLDAECNRTSQAKVAQKIGASKTTISQALNGVYPNEIGLLKLRDKVEGTYMGATITCPVFGDIPRDVCASSQEKELATHNPFRVQLFNTCPTCPNRRT